MFKSILFIALCTLALAECKPSEDPIVNRVARQAPSGMMGIPAEAMNAASQMMNAAMKAFSNISGMMGMSGGKGGGMSQMPGNQQG